MLHCSNEPYNLECEVCEFTAAWEPSQLHSCTLNKQAWSVGRLSVGSLSRQDGESRRKTRTMCDQSVEILADNGGGQWLKVSVISCLTQQSIKYLLRPRWPGIRGLKSKVAEEKNDVKYTWNIFRILCTYDQFKVQSNRAAFWSTGSVSDISCWLFVTDTTQMSVCGV